jgi:glycosyltransferase involved in cell wall biosynthesis
MISILMTAYNGEEYIGLQIESLLAQSFGDFTLYIRDDCSTDRTWEIINGYAKSHGDKIKAIKSEKNTGSAKHNFYTLMSQIRDDYLMLCDQDDIWLPYKIEQTLACMHRLEEEHGKALPLLVHTDLRVVDGGLNVISPSFKRAMNANYSRTELRDQVIQNTLTGCTCMYNRALAELITQPEPKYMVMHDWWLILTASAFGKVGHLDVQTVLYRQHGSNEIGAKNVRTITYKLDRLLHGEEVRQAISITYRQAESFLAYYGHRLTPAQQELLAEYCRIPAMNKLDRWRSIIKLRTFKNGFSRNVAYFLFV